VETAVESDPPPHPTPPHPPHTTTTTPTLQVESEIMWRGTIKKELLLRLRTQKPANVPTVDPARPDRAELIAAMRREELRQQLVASPELRVQVAVLRDRIKAMDNGTHSDAAHRFLNRVDLASNAHLMKKTPRPPPPPGMKTRSSDQTSLWCASWQLAMGGGGRA
jgi:hypothetical protein